MNKNLNIANLDKTNIKILQMLDLDSRMPLNKIAKYCHRSPESVAYRIKNLEKEGIIEKYYAIVNVLNAGMQLYKVYFNLKDINESKLDEIIDFVVKIGNVGNIRTTSGIFDMEIGIAVKDNLQFYAILNKIINKFANNIAGKQICIIPEMYFFNRKYLWESKPQIKNYHITKGGNLKIYNLKLLHEIIDSPRATLLEYSEKIRLSRQSVKMQKKLLEKNDIIQGYSIVINSEKLKLKKYRLFVRSNSDIARQIYEYCLRQPNIINLQNCLADWDFAIEIEMHESIPINSIIMDLKNQFPSISSIQYHELIKTKEYKFAFSE